MFKTIVIMFILIMLSACSGVSTSQAFICENQLFAVISDDNKNKIILRFNKKTYRLTLQASASGAKYVNDSILFWSKGNEAILIIDGVKQRCQQHE
ncbi:MliC family protein [Pseudoalteromonas mariniglutinosa]|uniref:MliC family protein n=1 Tax=Pseudoalteromonas mariniglutinosa TaxID=206042 RepID=UPI00385085EC